MKGDNITVEPLVLTQHKDVPDDATVVADCRPDRRSAGRGNRAARAVSRKGRETAAHGRPGDRRAATAAAKLTALAREWGIDIGNDVILDVSGRSSNPTYAVAAPPYPMHPITEKFRLEHACFRWLAR